jgi:hypothetical protein
MKKIIFAFLTMFSLNAFAMSIPVTEGMVNSKVSGAFPKTVKKIELSNPQITLLEGKSVLCMDGVPRIMFLDKPFKFCASFKPAWNEKEARLEATHLELMNMDINGVGNVPSSLRVILNEVLVGIEPLVLYKSDSWFLKQISTIEVEKGMMYLKF